MNKDKTLYVKTRTGWRNWLENNFDKEKEIWLVYPKKSSGETRIPYNDAVEEALCYGWIDSTHKPLDEEHTIQRFTPRKPKSGYSQPNKERLRWLAGKKLIKDSVAGSVQGIITTEYIFPEDIIGEIKRDRNAWENYQLFSESYKRIRIAYIDGARNRPEAFRKRLANFISKTRENKIIKGYGGIEKYY